MSFAIDANLLLYSVHRESEFHQPAKKFIESCVAGNELWMVPWTVVNAFLRIATHTSIFPNPLSPSQAVSIIDHLESLPHVQFLGENSQFWGDYRELLLTHRSRGNAVPDTLIASLLLSHGVTKLYTSDRDFFRFKGLKVINPLG